jgi:hypothetical protein
MLLMAKLKRSRSAIGRLFPAAAKLAKTSRLHSQTDAVHHEPSGFLGDSKRARNLVTTNPIAAVTNHPDRSYPLVQRDGRVLENSPDLRGELALEVNALALPLPLILEEHNIVSATSGTGDNAVGPAQTNHVSERVVGIVEVPDGFLESASVFHSKDRIAQASLIRQVYYCLVPSTESGIRRSI